MNIRMPSTTIFTYIIGILAISFIIFIHECGHFLACKLFDVHTPVFSIGFGPALAGITIGTTYFQIALLPLGGYVSIDMNQLYTLPMLATLLIMSAGVLVNIVFGYALLFTQSWWLYKKDIYAEQLLLHPFSSRAFIGPIALIKILGTAGQLSKGVFLDILARLSISIGILNLLPIPGLDGSKILQLFIEKIY